MKEKKKLSSNKDQMVDLYSVFLDVAKEWLFILLITASAAIIAHVGLSRLRAPKYASYAVVAVNNYNTAADLNNAAGADAYSNMSYEVSSSRLLVEMLKGSEIKEAVADDLGAPFSGTITAEVPKETNFVKFTVESPSALTSFLEARSVIRCYDRIAGNLLGGTHIEVVRQPRVLAGATGAAASRKYVIAFAAIVFLGAVFVLAFRSYLRETVRNSSEVSGKVDAAFLGAVARRETLLSRKKGVLITDPDVNTGYAQDLRRLAVRVQNEMTAKRQQILLVAGAGKAEGKTTVAANLALAMAECGRSVILVDMNFRNPSVYKILGLPESKAGDLGAWLEEASRGRSADKASGVRTPLAKVPGTGLRVILNRKANPQAVEDYPAQIRKLLHELRNQADFIIIDTAAANFYADTEELSRLADTSLIVVRENHSEVPDIDKAVDNLGGRERMLGCIFNDARKNGAGAAASSKEYGYWGNYAK